MVEESFLTFSKIFQRPCSKPPTDFIHNFNVRRIFLFERFELPGRMHDAIEAKFAPMTSESLEGFESTSECIIVPSVWTVGIYGSEASTSSRTLLQLALRESQRAGRPYGWHHANLNVGAKGRRCQY